MKAAKLDLVIDKGSTFRRFFQLQHADGSPMPLTNYTIRGKIRKSYSSSIWLNLNPSITDAALGKWKIEIPGSVTTTVGFSYGVYDVEIENILTNDPDKILFGAVAFREEVTK